MSIVGVLETQVRASTQDFERGMQRASGEASKFGSQIARVGTRSAAAFGQAMTAVAASSAAAEKNWTTLGATVLSSFAMGGPVMGAVTAAGALVGLLTAEFKESGRAAEEAAKKWQKEFEAREAAIGKIADETARINRETRRRLLGLSPEEMDVRDAQKALVESWGRIADIREQLEGRQLTTIPREMLLEDLEREKKTRGQLVRSMEEAQKHAEAVARSQRVTAQEAEEELGARERMKALETAPLPSGLGGIHRGTRMDWAEAESRRFRSMFTRAEPDDPVPFADLLGSDLLPFPEDDRQARWDADLKRIEEAERAARDRERKFREAMESAERQAQENADRWAAPFHDAFASAIVDGARTGFKNLEDIGESLFADWLGMASRALSQRLFGGAFDALFGAGAPGGAQTIVLQPVVPSTTIQSGIASSSALQGTVHHLGAEITSLEEYRRSP